jgi:hypothetical protein
MRPEASYRMPRRRVTSYQFRKTPQNPTGERDQGMPISRWVEFFGRPRQENPPGSSGRWAKWNRERDLGTPGFASGPTDCLADGGGSAG